MVILKIKDKGDIEIELDYQAAPNTCRNFVCLASKGFYDGLTFHRVIRDFMIQGGCPLGIGTGNPGYSIKGEFRINGFDNPLRHERGVISMARSMDPNSAGSQFFICDHDDFFLDGQYAAFGRVKKGMNVVDAIAKTPKDRNDRPLQKVIIEKAIVLDEDIVEPEKM